MDPSTQSLSLQTAKVKVAEKPSASTEHHPCVALVSQQQHFTKTSVAVLTAHKVKTSQYCCTPAEQAC